MALDPIASPIVRRPALAESLWASTAAFLALAAILTAGGARLAALSGGAPKLDFLWAASPQVYRRALEAYGEGGRRLFAWLNAVDFLFPVAVVWLGRALLHEPHPPTPSPLAGRGRRGRGGALGWVPVAFALLDWVENLLFFGILGLWPTPPDVLLRACAKVTTAKLTLLAVSYALFAVAAAALAFRRVNGARMRR